METVIPATPYRHSRHPLPSFPNIYNRPSRVSGNPAAARQDCGIIRQYLSGFPLAREGR